MAEILLRTKLFLPQLRPSLVPRPHLIQKLNTGLDRKLTLISAPAGFGKTTLVSEWIHQTNCPVAWLSLDESDNDLHRFLTYFVAAIQTINDDIGKTTLTMLQTPGGDIEGVLIALLNEISESAADFILVLDDYHVIESPPIDQATIFILTHLPPQMHLVIASRMDPSLPLSRLRARGQMTEIRIHDLRFRLEETAVFLNQILDIQISAQEVAALGKRTEGWIAGLQLAALSLQGFEQVGDISDFISRLTGSDRYIQDYLTDEVLQKCPEGIRDFLLQTSILHRLSAPLCNVVIGKNDSQAILENLEAANLFIIPLDNERRWFRYHHLFADLLRQRLRQTQPEQMAALHGRASEWYEQNGFTEEAINHALHANDFERASSLAELAWPEWQGSYQSIQWLGWLKTLPDDLVRARPVLSLSYAWAYLNAGNLEAANARLQDVERWLEPTQQKASATKTRPERSRRMIVVDEEQFRLLPISLATARAYHAQAIGDVSGTVKHTRRVLDLLPEEDSHWRPEATVILGIAYWTSGDLEEAHQTFSAGLAGMKPLDIIVGTFVLADIKMALGQFRAAIRTCEYALRLAIEQGEPLPLGTEDVYTEISKLHREQGDLEAAAQDLATSKKLGEQIELPDWQYRWCIAQARLKETLGDLDGALNLLDEAERVFVRTPLPKVRSIPAMKARVWIKQGQLDKALGWSHGQGLSVDDNLSYLHEFEHITLAKLLIAQHKRDDVDNAIHDAMKLLKRLLQAAEEGKRMGSVIEILALQALAYEAQGDTSSARMSLERALTIAKPEGYVRIFVDEGLPMAKLLQEAANQGIELDYAHKLLAAFKPTAQSDSRIPPQPLVEPLSERELEVLRLVAQGLTNRQISERLFLALDTVKGYNRRIFGKLAVKNRAQAVNKAISLKILPPQ